jgi:phosphoesterase RecJ-like protein
MVGTNRFQEAVCLLKKSANVLITTHTKPDGDACGCLAALSEALTALGKKANLLLVSPLPQWYQFLFAEKVPILGDDVSPQQVEEGKFGQFDLIIIVDTDSFSQLVDLKQYIKQTDRPILVIDHHVTGDNLGDVALIDSDAAATGLILLDLFKYANWPITTKIAEAIFVTIGSDTGWFHFSNTDSRAYRSCVELIDAGAKPTEIYDKLYQNFSYPRFKLMVALLNTLQLHFDGRYATQYLSQRDFQQAGAAYQDTENLINECHRIGTVKVSALFVELADERIRCSLRSKCDIDVSQIAAKFGGGGHKMAAGTYLQGPLAYAMRIIYKQVAAQMARPNSCEQGDTVADK